MTNPIQNLTEIWDVKDTDNVLLAEYFSPLIYSKTLNIYLN